MEEKEREIWVGEDRLYLGENNILYVIKVGEANEKNAASIKDASFRLVNLVEGQVNVFVDINKSGKASPKARKIWKELSEHEKFGKVALFGLHPIARVIASFIIGSSNKKYFRFFKTKQEAIAWLKEVE